MQSVSVCSCILIWFVVLGSRPTLWSMGVYMCVLISQLCCIKSNFVKCKCMILISKLCCINPYFVKCKCMHACINMITFVVLDPTLKSTSVWMSVLI